MSYLDPYGSSEPRGREEEGRPRGRARHAAREDQPHRARHPGAAPDGYPQEPGYEYEAYDVDRMNGRTGPATWPGRQLPAGYGLVNDRPGAYGPAPGVEPDAGGHLAPETAGSTQPADAFYPDAETAVWPQVADAHSEPPPQPGRRRAASRPARNRPAGSGRAGRNLPAAIAVGIVLATAILVPLFLYRSAFLAVPAAAAGIGVWEVARAVRARGARPPMTALIIGGMLTVGLAWWGGPDALTLGLLVTIVAALVWRLSDGRDGYWRDATAAVAIAVYVPFLTGFAAMLATPSDGQWRVFVTLAAVVLTDTGGYAAGVFLGTHPMAPTVSPKKSWEGFCGSVIAASVGSAVLVFLLLGIEPWWGAVFGLAVCVAAVLGDLAESIMKRDLGIKDMSHLLPGHGGLMDRLDSILFALPTAYLILSIFLPEQ